jgi:HAD superfamily hydrolase (TIGR01509 family)
MELPAIDVSKIDLVIFDCDGVLVDSEPLIRTALRKTMSDADLPVPDDAKILHYRGLSSATVVRMIEGEFHVALPDFGDAWRAQILQQITSSARPIPGVIKALAQIDHAICVASSGEPEKIATSLRVAGMSNFFGNNLFSATQVPNGKPAPDLFLFAAKTMGVPPERCIVVEDAVPGVQGAVAAGMQVLGFAHESDANELAGAGAVTFDSMRELPSLLTGRQQVMPRDPVDRTRHLSL